MRIEGTFRDYIMPGPFATAYKYTLSIRPQTTAIAARNVSRLSGTKTAASGTGGAAGSVELHGVDAAPTGMADEPA